MVLDTFLQIKFYSWWYLVYIFEYFLF